MEGLKISKAGMADLLEEAHTALVNLQQGWQDSDNMPQDKAYSRWGMDGEAGVAYIRDGLEIRLWVERGDDSLYGSIKSDGLLDIQEELMDEYNNADEQLVPVLFWRLYGALAKEAKE